MTSQFPTTPDGVRIPDYCSQAGAALLVARITAYWAARGKAVSVWAQEVPCNLDAGKRTFVVRSTMQGGQP